MGVFVKTTAMVFVPGTISKKFEMDDDEGKVRGVSAGVKSSIPSHSAPYIFYIAPRGHSV